MTLRLLPTAIALTFVAAFFAACDLDALLGGDECSADSDCSGDDICDSGECVECENDRDCEDDEECNDGECERADTGEGEGEGEEGEGEGEGEGEEGEGEGEGEPGCGDLTIQGECDGNTLRLCLENAVSEFNCSDEGATCELINPQYGFDCAIPTGGACIADDGQGGSVILTCDGSQPGCHLVDGAATCDNGAGTCGVDDVETCVGDRFIIGCAGLFEETQTNGQAAFFDCGDLGATCFDSNGCLVTTTGGACLPGVSKCGADVDTAVDCPDTRVCP